MLKKAFSHLKDSATLLLVITGALLGLTFPLGKLASEASIDPLAWAWLISAGAGIVLLIVQISSRKNVPLSKSYLKYYGISAAFSLLIPNILIFNVIPKLGSGFTSILFTLSPIATLALSSLWQVRMPSRLGVIGIVVGLLGALTVTLTRGEIDNPASLNWILAGLCIPMSLAVGNLYRTMAWPKGSGPLELAIGSNLAAAMLLLTLIIMRSDAAAFQDLLSIKSLALTQVFVSAAMFSVFFRLQQVGGPTFLSQIGYVAAGVALFVGTFFLEEKYSFITWLGAAIIVVGIGFSVVAQKKH